MATADPEECAEFSYCVVYGTDPEEVFFPDDYSLETLSGSSTITFKGLPSLKDPFVTNSPFEIRIKADFGAYGATYSEFATLTITDPCFQTQINAQSIGDMIAQIADGPSYQNFDFFTDTVSQLYTGAFGDGSGYDICGT